MYIYSTQTEIKKKVLPNLTKLIVCNHDYENNVKYY